MQFHSKYKLTLKESHSLELQNFQTGFKRITIYSIEGTPEQNALFVFVKTFHEPEFVFVL